MQLVYQFMGVLIGLLIFFLIYFFFGSHLQVKTATLHAGIMTYLICTFLAHLPKIRFRVREAV